MSLKLSKRTKISQKSFILLEFTKELIKHSAKGDVFELENVLGKEAQKKEEKGFTEKSELNNNYFKSRMKRNMNKAFERKIEEKIHPIKRRIIRRNLLPKLIIPKQRLSPRFQYLKPTPGNLEIDLGKLNSLVKDPLVQEIESSGANNYVVVSGKMGRKKTEIKLTREEIEEIAKKFSEVSKIPLQEGFFKVAVGRLVFSAVISNIVSPKFTIKKIDYNIPAGY